MERNGRPRRRPEAPSLAPTTLHEITRRYVATALALAKALGLPYTETFLREHRESITSCYIQAGMEGLRLPSSVVLPALVTDSSESPKPELPSVSLEVADLPDNHVSPPPEPTRDPLPPGEGEVTADAYTSKAPTADPHGGGELSLPVSENSNPPVPTHVPREGDWPCAGQAIHALKPAQLHLLISRAGFRAHTDTTVIPLLASLQGERERRLAAGQRPKAVAGAGNGSPGRAGQQQS